MSSDRRGTHELISTATEYPVGLTFELEFDRFSVKLSSLPGSELLFVIAEGPFAKTETVRFDAVNLRPGVFLVSWKEASGATVVHVEDFDEMVVYSYATLPDGSFLTMRAPIHVTDFDGGSAA